MSKVKDFDLAGLYADIPTLDVNQEGYHYFATDTGKSYRWNSSSWDLISDNSISVAGLLEMKGSTDCSGNPNYPSALVGDAYYVTVAGKIGGASGKSVDVGDLYVAKADNAGGTEGSVGSSWFVLEHNLVGALVASNNLSDLANVITARANLGIEAAKVDVSSNTTTNIGAATSMIVRITGTTTITAFDTVADGIWRMGYFSGALTFTHNGTSLILPGGANITTAAGDTFIALSMGSGNWRVILYQKADGTAIVGSGGGGGGGALVQKVGNVVSAKTDGTVNTIPYDDTIPQNTEGDEYITQAITPTNSSHVLYIHVTVFGSVSASGYMIVALFQDSTANALAAIAEYIDSGTASSTLHFVYKMTAGTTSATTFKVRAGASTGSFTFNGRTSTGRIFGGAAASSITIEEVTP